MIRVISPATSANLGPGFDVLAIALESPHDIMEFSEIEDGIEIEVSGYTVPSSPQENIAGVVAGKIMEDFGIEEGVKISIHKGIRPRSGLGSSAASSVGATLGVSELFGLALSRDELLEYALLGEKTASNSAHADNISACLLGGLTIALTEPLKAFRVEVSSDIGYAALLPGIEVSTREARKLLPEKIPLKEYSHNLAKACLLVRALEEGNFEELSLACEDSIVTPLRSKLVPFYEELKKEALSIGAKAFFISGSGPATLALFNRREVDVREMALHLEKFYSERGVEAKSYWGKVGEGARVI